MRRVPVEFADSWEIELQEIWAHIREGSPQNADDTITRLLDAAASLGEFPRKGRPAPRYGADIRLWACRPYVLVYRAEPTRVVVLHAFHGARDLRALLELDD